MNLDESVALNSDDLVDTGEQHHRAGRLREAEAHYRKALDIDPGHPGALYFLAGITYEDGRLPVAEQFTKELLQNNQSDAEAWHLLGLIARKNGNPALAQDYFIRALSIQPAFPQAHYDLGDAQGRQSDLNAALASFQRALSLNPAFAEAHCAVGNVLSAQGNLNGALTSYRQAIAVKPNLPQAYEGIARILQAEEKWEEAIALGRQGTAVAPENALLHIGLGTAYFYTNQYTDAAYHYELATTLDPLSFAAHVNLGNASFKLGNVAAAIAAFRQALALNPQDTGTLEKLAGALYASERIDEAAAIYRRWVALEPENAVPRHYLAACTGEAIPERAEDAYVEHTFDDFAKNFDTQLEQLNYRGPELIAAALRQHGGDPRKQFAILDGGCGTGLCGPLIAEYSAHLTGVDLSAGMLNKAATRGVYNDLIKAELTAFLQSRTHAFDVALTADTFIYFGALTDVFAATHAALRANGLFLFTVESAATAETGGLGYRLNPHGRYSHSEDYLRNELESAEFDIITIEDAIIRHENGRAVEGLVVSCRARICAAH